MNCCARETARETAGDTTEIVDAASKLMQRWACELVQEIDKSIREELEHDASSGRAHECLKKARAAGAGKDDELAWMVCCLVREASEPCVPEATRNGAIKILNKWRKGALEYQSDRAEQFRIKSRSLRCDLPRRLRYWFDMQLETWRKPLADCGCSTCCGRLDEKKNSCACRGKVKYPCYEGAENNKCCGLSVDLYWILTGEHVHLDKASSKPSSPTAQTILRRHDCWKQVVDQVGNEISSRAEKEFQDRQSVRGRIKSIVVRYKDRPGRVRTAALALGFSVIDLDRIGVLLDDDCVDQGLQWTDQWSEYDYWEAARRVTNDQLDLLEKELERMEKELTKGQSSGSHPSSTPPGHGQ
jgi:hypothetical protein